MHIKYLNKEIIKLFFYQLFTIAVVNFIIVLFCGIGKFIPLFFGSTAYILPQAIFILFINFFLNKNSNLFIIGFFCGESIKIIISAALCILFINYLLLDHLFSIIGFIIGFISLWLVYGYYFLSNKNLQRD